MKTKFSEKDIADALKYLESLKDNPSEKARFNRSVKATAARERKRKNGEISAMFIDAIRIP